jgi:hypothetical protein
MEPEPSIDFLVSAASGRPEIVIIPEEDAQFLAGAVERLRTRGRDAERTKHRH